MMEGFGQAMRGEPAQSQQATPAREATGQQPTSGGGMGLKHATGVPATPEQQAQYNRFYAYSILMLYNEDFIPKVQELFQKSPNAVEAAARVGSAIATRIYMGASKNGATIPPEVMLHAGQEVMGEIAEMARVSGLADLSEEDVETAYYLAADMTRSALEKAGKIDGKNAQADLENIRSLVGDDKLNEIVQRMGAVQQQSMEAMKAQAMQGRQANGGMR